MCKNQSEDEHTKYHNPSALTAIDSASKSTRIQHGEIKSLFHSSLLLSFIEPELMKIYNRSEREREIEEEGKKNCRKKAKEFLME